MALLSGRIRVAVDALRGSYWLVPALMVAAAVVLAVLTASLDDWVVPDTGRPWGRWLSTAGPDGARAVLSTIAASMITLASLTYSLTLVALTLAAGQYGPRLLRTFMRDRVTQVGLGAFLATFVFCLGALRAVRPGNNPDSVPHISVALGMLMAGLCLAYLVYFIHHVASSINATSVIDAVSRELKASIGRPGDESGDEADDHQHDALPPGVAPDDARRVASGMTGYVTVTDHAALVKKAESCDGRIWVAVRPGDFVVEGEPLAWLDAPSDEEPEAVRLAIVVGPERTMLQDVEFGVAQLVEVALRALSPGINDPFTAMSCIDQLGAALVALARHPPAPTRWRGAGGTVRVYCLRVPTFEGALRAAFDPLRQAARGHVGVLIRLAEALDRIGRAARDDTQRTAVARQLNMVAASARDAVPEPNDRDDVLARVQEARNSPRSSPT